MKKVIFLVSFLASISAYAYLTPMISSGGTGAVDSVFGRTGVVSAATNDYTWAQVNKATSSLADLATRASTNLSDTTNLVRKDAANTFSVGQQQITIANNAHVGLTIQGSASPAANLLSIQNSAGTVLAGLSSAFKWTGDGSLLTGIVATAPSCTIATDTGVSGNPYGSTNTKIRRWTNVVGSCSDLTYAASAANGDTVTINTAGVYSVTYCDGSSSGVINMGISKNSNQLTTGITSITTANILAVVTSASGTIGCVSVTVPLAVSDVLRAHTNADGVPYSVTYTGFRVSRAH